MTKNIELSRKECLYNVKMIPSSQISLPGVLFTSRNEYAIVVETPEGLKKVKDCSADYKLISNREVIIPLEEELSKKFKFKAIYNHHDYQKYYISYIIQTDDKSELLPLIKLHTSYDGSLKHTIKTGSFRKLDSTTLMRPESNTKFKHSSRMSENFAIEIMMDLINEYIEEYSNSVKIYEPLFERVVDKHTDRIHQILSQTKFPARQRSEVVKKVEDDAQKINSPITDWLIYNSFNFQLNYNSKIGLHEEDKEKMDEKVLEFMLK